MAKEGKENKEAPKPDAPPADPKAAPEGKRGKTLTFAVFGGVMLVEGLAIFMCMKLLGHEPDPTVGMEGLAPTTKPWEESSELPVVQVRVPNNNGARPLLYSVKVVVQVHHGDKQKVQEFLENRKSTIEDTIGRVIRSADEKHLAEPGMETLKRQVRYELSSLIGDEKIIERVLIPECVPLPAGF
jgi:flagellar basal body-associated protein FliL